MEADKTVHFQDSWIWEEACTVELIACWCAGTQPLICVLYISLPVFPAKEIQLMHRAPVVGILVLDGQSTPLPEPLEVAHDLAKSPNMQGSHQLLVVSEEQFKVTVLHVSWIFQELFFSEFLHGFYLLSNDLPVKPSLEGYFWNRK